jgi:hypothetical protein
MCSIYLINVGVNASHESKARSPIFNDNLSFVYVSIPDHAGTPYPPEMRPFVRDPDKLPTHSDPDWDNLTYGDDCLNPRASALINVTRGDILLFWGLLWQNNRQNNGNNWHGRGFTGERGWYLLGALRVEDIVERKQDINNLPAANCCRALKNAHSLNPLWHPGDRVFVGEINPSHSRLFEHAVDLGGCRCGGLIYSGAFTAADHTPFTHGNGRCWLCGLRTCRKMWDLNDAEQRGRAEIVRNAIRNVNRDFDLLEDAHCDPKCR